MRKGADGRRTHQSRRIALCVLVVLCLATVCSFLAQNIPTPSESVSSRSGTASVKVDVDLVLVNATVTDVSNRFVIGLDREHFKIYEDKVEQKISHFSTEDIPSSIGILFDVSSSMGTRSRERKMRQLLS